MIADTINSPLTAFLAGLVTSVHCAGMCGPLACLLTPASSSPSGFTPTAAAYQATRLLTYLACGAVAGGLGLLALGWVEIYHNSLARFLPWALVAFFIILAFRLDRLLPKSRALSRLVLRWSSRFRRLPGPLAGAALGLATPLLPCGPLYLLLGLCVLTQSPVRGAELAISFGLGTLPLLWLVQAGLVHWRGRLNPLNLAYAQRGLALVAAAVLAWRLFAFETSPHGLFCGS